MYGLINAFATCMHAHARTYIVRTRTTLAISLLIAITLDFYDVICYIMVVIFVWLLLESARFHRALVPDDI